MNWLEKIFPNCCQSRDTKKKNPNSMLEQSELDISIVNLKKSQTQAECPSPNMSEETSGSSFDYRTIMKEEYKFFESGTENSLDQISLDSQGSVVVRETKNSMIRLKPCFECKDVEKNKIEKVQNDAQNLFSKFQCVVCGGNATGFCIGCLDKRYCKSCHIKTHSSKSVIHQFCSYSRKTKGP
ncbi:unnamed protein product [Blepharisma stoltei]|uniref:Uncharacterized protein n=1 Tax=Blepharisma stoltei TaxID=1481888 RepID=A0AAU9IWA7_9CILI|nr:unnamed protein product [Blepharisma stoltei]